MQVQPPATAQAPRTLADEFRYPSVDPGIPALKVDALLAAHQDLIDRIKLCFGMDRSTFEQSIVTLLRRYAAYVHLLPCTPDNYFNAPGGLLRLGIETAFYALQGTDAHIFSGRATISERTHLEPRWRQATFLAGLCSELHRPLSQFIVTDQAGNEWSPYLGPLADWLARHQIERYFLKWRPNAQETRSLGLFALPHVVSAEVLQDLSSGNAQIVPHLLATVSGIPAYRDHNVVEALVRRALALVIDQALRASAEHYGKPQLGSHLERYLVDALRRLVASSSSWKPNADRSRVWYAVDGMFLVWPSAADDIRKLLEADQLPGIPKSSETILEVLLGCGILTPQATGSTTWAIHPPGSKAAVESVKLATPAILHPAADGLPDPLPDALLSAPPKAKGSSSASPSVHDARQGGAGNRVRSTDAATAPVHMPVHTPDIPAQLSLLPAPPSDALPPEASSNAVKVTPTTTVEQPAQAPMPELLAPLKLPVKVRDALAEVLGTLQGPPEAWAALPQSHGLFVPLASLTSRKVTPPEALRGLTDSRMLSSPRAVTRRFKDQDTVGLLLSAKHVQGVPFPDSASSPKG